MPFQNQPAILEASNDLGSDQIFAKNNNNNPTTTATNSNTINTTNTHSQRIQPQISQNSIDKSNVYEIDLF